MESKQHVQLPNNMANSKLTPKDMLIYVSIKRYMNNATKIAFPSLQKIRENCGASINTIRDSIKRLEDNDYIQVIKSGRSQSYKFNPYKEFEPFSYEFLDKKDLTFTEKAFLLASQQFMIKDIEGKGKISYTNKELSEKINMPESTISKTNRDLVRKNYLVMLKNTSRDIETGCNTMTKIFKLDELGQAVIWALSNHEDRITQLEKQMEEKNKLIERLLREREVEHVDFIL